MIHIPPFIPRAGTPTRPTAFLPPTSSPLFTLTCVSTLSPHAGNPDTINYLFAADRDALKAMVSLMRSADMDAARLGLQVGAGQLSLLQQLLLLLLPLPPLPPCCTCRHWESRHEPLPVLPTALIPPPGSRPLQFTEMVLRLLDTGVEAVEEVDGIDAIEAVQVCVHLHCAASPLALAS